MSWSPVPPERLAGKRRRSETSAVRVAPSAVAERALPERGRALPERDATRPGLRPRTARLSGVYDRLPAIAIGLVAALINLRILEEGGFFLDDFRNIRQSLAPLSIHLLLEPIGGTHLQPVNRFLEWLAGTPLHESYTGSVVVLCVISALGTYWLIRLLDTISGPRRANLAIGFLFGASPVMIGAAQWVAAAATSAVAVDFAAGACLGFVRWLSTGSRKSYALALVATGLAVGSWETALATPAIITLMWLCFARDWQPTRRAVIAQLPLYAISLVYVVYVEFQPWHQSLTPPGIVSWLALLAVMVGRALAASVIGTVAPGGAQTTFDWIGEVAVVVAFAAAATWLAVRRRLRWGVLAVFAIGTALVSIPVATTRESLGATIAGTTPRYLTFLPLLLAIAAAGALRPRAVRDRRARSVRMIAWLPIVLAAFAGYLFNLSHSFNSGEDGVIIGSSGRADSDRIAAGIAALGRSGERSLVDSTVPPVIYYSGYSRYDELSALLPFWSAAARTFGEGRIAGVDQNGYVIWGAFHPGRAGPQYVRVIVRSSAPTTAVVRISGVKPAEPEIPWRIPMSAGTHSFTLAAWSTAVRRVAVSGRNVKVLSVKKGTVTLGSLVLK